MPADSGLSDQTVLQQQDSLSCGATHPVPVQLQPARAQAAAAEARACGAESALAAEQEAKRDKEADRDSLAARVAELELGALSALEPLQNRLAQLEHEARRGISASCPSACTCCHVCLTLTEVRATLVVLTRGLQHDHQWWRGWERPGWCRSYRCWEHPRRLACMVCMSSARCHSHARATPVWPQLNAVHKLPSKMSTDS